MAFFELIAKRDKYLKRIEFIDNTLERFYSSIKDIELYCRPDEEAKWLHQLLTTKAKHLDKEADFLVSTIGDITEHLIGADCNYYGVCTDSIH